ncbi:hypothetical protein [Prochlorococcus marinus]|uniref:hypothetical protein n=1 Tax=Prochlorococcus marinus TaxID=1219 RepID=UPI0022B3981D|nr:hypothetical protein [Prochlorococcus marinus]
MKKLLAAFLLSTFPVFTSPVKADFGDADFPIDLFKNSPQSYHDGWCRFIKNKCRIRFQGKAMWVEGQGGIYLSQFENYRYDTDKGDGHNLVVGDRGEYYNYISYRSENGGLKEALFLFAKHKAQRNFSMAFMRWVEQKPEPTRNYRFPNSQGPQDTQGRDKGLNPYDNEPITDWSIKTTKESPAGINCDSAVWRNKPQCID